MKILLICGFLLACVFAYLYFNLRKKVKLIIKVDSDKRLHGYIDFVGKQKNKITSAEIDYKIKVFVTELEKYKNGESKIKIDNVKIISDESGLDIDRSTEFVIKNIPEIVKTNEVEWLEIEESLKERRKEKLNKLKKALNC